jgi:Fic family protein
MLKKGLTKQSTGRLEPTFLSHPEIDHGFVPNPLPPDWKWPNALWPVLLEAHKALATLDGFGEHLPNPKLLLRPLQQREAQKSSRLEGTITDPQQQALFEAAPESVDPDAEVSDFREVQNYAQALKDARTLREELPISLRFIRRLHKTLMTGVRGQDKRPGRFREAQNMIGKPPRFIPPPPPVLNDTLSSFEKYLHTDHTFDPLVEAFLVHYQFEAIHPFADGNGRVGRLLLAILIEEWCKLSDPWLYMSDFFDRNKDDYIDKLYNVSATGDWTGWIGFCLRGVREQARDTHLRCQHLLDLYKKFHDKVNASGGSVRLSKIVDMLFDSPVLIAAKLPGVLDVTYPTVRSDLDQLADLGIIDQLFGAKRITYMSMQVLDMIRAEHLPDRGESPTSWGDRL